MADRASASRTLLNCIVPSQWDADLHVLPASPLLEGAERELMGVAGAPYRLADPLAAVSGQYAAVVIDTRPSFSLLTEMGLLAASVIARIHDIRAGWRHPALRVSGLLITKMNARIRGHNHLLDEVRAHPLLGRLVLGVIPANEAVSYAHSQHQSLFAYDPRASASRAYAQVAAQLARDVVSGGA
jgi:chromosome partitioning protein